VLGEVKEAGMETVLAFAVHVALDDDSLHGVVQDLARHAAECSESALVAADQCGHLHVADERAYRANLAMRRATMKANPVCMPDASVAFIGQRAVRMNLMHPKVEQGPAGKSCHGAKILCRTVSFS
jgi:hypothetical protein